MSKPDPEKVQETIARLNAEEKMIAVPQGLLAAAFSAIDKKREGPMTLALLRHYVFNGDPAQASEYADAYRGARDDLAIWKRRALEAEEKLHRLDSLPAPVIVADLSEEDMKEFERDLEASRPSAIIVKPRQQPEPVAWQCLRKGPGRFVVTLERAVADEWARKGWPVRALCECNSQSAFVSATDYLRDRAKDPE